ncbi:MAG: hypothetical protein ACUVQ1_00855 [Candidatus Kapaibacteriales bacterium]
MKRTTPLYLVLILIISQNVLHLFAKDSKFSVESIIGFGINHHTGNFNGIPNNSCCISFENGSGSGLSLSLNLQIKQKNKVFNSKVSPFFQISYLNYSGLFAKDEYFANFIYRDEVFPAISRHSFDAKIQALELLIGSVFSDHRILEGMGIRFALGISFPFISKYNQQEELFSPEMAFFENGTKFRNVIHSTIPTTNPQINFVTSIHYSIFRYKNLELLPIFSFRLPFFDVAKNVRWKVYRFELALAGKYIIPEPPSLKPLEPPFPEFPNPLPPPKTTPIAFDINIKINNLVMKNGDTFEIKREKIVHYSREIILPVLFFERNDFNLTLENIELDSKIKKQQESNIKVLSAVVNFLHKNPKSKLKIISSRLDDELSNMSNLRGIQVLEFLRQNGIDQKNIIFEEKVYKMSNFSHPELANEYRRVQLLLDGEMKILDIENVIQIDTITEPIIVEITPEAIEPKNLSVNIKGQVFLPSKQKNFENVRILDTIELKFFDGSSSSIKIQARAEGDDINFKGGNLIKEIQCVFRDYVDKIEIPFEERVNTKYYLIGLCDFDKSNFYWTNPDIKKIVDSLIKDGKKLKIFGSTDDFGKERHNQQLALKRALNAQKILKTELKISTDDTLNLGKPVTLERIFRRSAWLVVQD